MSASFFFFVLLVSFLFCLTDLGLEYETWGLLLRVWRKLAAGARCHRGSLLRLGSNPVSEVRFLWVREISGDAFDGAGEEHGARGGERRHREAALPEELSSPA